MWKIVVAWACLWAGQGLAQTAAAPDRALDLRPYVEAIAASGAYLPGRSQKSLHLANYDEPSHQALSREVFSTRVLGGALVEATHLHATGSLMPTAARWSEKRYLFAADYRCAVFINVRDVEARLAQTVPHAAAFAVWHEFAHCTLRELMQASVASAGDGKSLALAMAASLATVLPDAQAKLALTLFNEAYADTFALLVQARVGGTDAARALAQGALKFRALERQTQDEPVDSEAQAHDTRIALSLALDLLNRYDLAELSPRDRTVLAMNIAIEASIAWGERAAGSEAGAALRRIFSDLERRLLPAIAAADTTQPVTSAAIPVYLAFPAPGTRSLSMRPLP